MQLCRMETNKILKKKYGWELQSIMVIQLMFLCGLFISATSLLPSTISMMINFLVLTAYVNRNMKCFITLNILSLWFGWSYATIANIPLFVDLVFQNGVLNFGEMHIKLQTCIFLSSAILTVGIDRIFYGKFTIPHVNIVMYNLPFGNSNANLYGTESWCFYLKNMLLNFNLSFLLSLIPRIDSVIWASQMLYIWMFSLLKHKEERFMYPIYPLVLFNSSIQILKISHLLKRKEYNIYNVMKNWKWIVLLTLSILGVSRTVLIHKAGGVVDSLFHDMYENNRYDILGSSCKGQVNVCMSSYWHMFPGHFMVPLHRRDNCTIHIQIIKSEHINCLVPTHYHTKNNTWYDSFRTSNHCLNNRNREQKEQYFDSSLCDGLISDENPYRLVEGTREEDWTKIHCRRRIETKGRKKMYIYIPFLTEYLATWKEVCLWKRTIKVHPPKVC